MQLSHQCQQEVSNKLNGHPVDLSVSICRPYLGDGVQVVDRVLEVGGARGDEDGVLGRVEAQRVGGRAAATSELQNGPEG